MGVLLYNNEIIVSHFDIQAWYNISQHITGESYYKIFSAKRKSLLGKRYFIVLNDMWDGMAMG